MLVLGTARLANVLKALNYSEIWHRHLASSRSNYPASGLARFAGFAASFAAKSCEFLLLKKGVPGVADFFLAQKLHGISHPRRQLLTKTSKASQRDTYRFAREDRDMRMLLERPDALLCKARFMPSCVRPSCCQGRNTPVTRS